MKFFLEDKDMLNSVLSQLKVMGIKVPKVKKVKINIPKQDKGPLQSNNKVFGVCLADQEGASNSNPPKFILSCTEYLQKYSKEIGLFRKAGSVARQKNLRVKIENGGSFDGSEANDVASLLKQWLRELPEPLIPYYLHDSFIRCQNLNNDSRITATLLICLLLPPDHLQTLKHLMGFLADIATDKDKNKMDVPNLALIMTPNVFIFGNNSIDKSSNIKVQQFTAVIQLLIENANKIGEIPSSLTLKLPNLVEKCELELNSPGEVFESSPTISKKQYLLRSFKKLVKPNTTSVNNPATTLDSSSTLLRQTLSVNSIERVCLKATAEAKGNSHLFVPRNSDVCKRSFRLLMRKDKRGLKPSKECHPFTQSLEIQSPLNFEKEVDKIKMYPSVQVPLSEVKSDVGNFWTIDNFDNEHSGLEDIEMTTFSTHVNEQSNNLAAFPIPSCSQYPRPKHFLSKLEKFNDKTDTKYFHFPPLPIANDKEKTGECKNLPQEVGIENETKIPKDIWIYGSGHSIDYRDLQQPKTLTQNSCKVNELKLPVGGNQKHFSNRKVEPFRGMKEFKSSSGGHDSMDINKHSLHVTNTKVVNKSSGNSDKFKVLREGTFIIEPSRNSTSTVEIQRPCIDEIKRKKFAKNTADTSSHDNPSQKRHCTALSSRSKTHSKNPPVKRASTKSVSSRKVNVAINKSFIKQSALQKSKNSTRVKGCTNVLNLNNNRENSKIFVNQTISSHSELGKPDLQTRKSQISKMHSTLPASLAKDEFLKNTDSSPKNTPETSLMSKRKLSFSRYPVTTNSHSDSKIPRLRTSFEVSGGTSFSEEATNHLQKVSKTIANAASRDNATKIPVKCNNKNNLSTLDLSINDSCFLTPNRNALLSPNSVVWMSGNKYFSSNSPEEMEAFNKRESIAMILKTNLGHVQEKVHLYDDLIRESVDSSPTVPSHSTPTSKFSRRLSSSQSMKSTPKPRTNAQNGNSASFKTSMANRSNSIKNEKSLKSYDPPKFTTHLNTPSPIKSHSLKDVTNTSVGFNGSKNPRNNFQRRDETFIFLDENSHGSIRKNRKPKGKSFSGKTAQKFVKKVSRSESSPGYPRPYLRVACLIQESNCEE